MNLKQIKADRANGVLISSCTWDAVLDRAIELESALSVGNICSIEPSSGMGITVKFMSTRSANQFNEQLGTLWMESMKTYGVRSDSAAIGKPKKVTEELSLAARLSGSGLGKLDGGN